jgi:hypothetical protein
MFDFPKMRAYPEKGRAAITNSNIGWVDWVVNVSRNILS